MHPRWLSIVHNTAPCWIIIGTPVGANRKRETEQGVWWRKPTGVVALRKVRVQRAKSTKDGENAPQEAAENTLNSTPPPQLCPCLKALWCLRATGWKKKQRLWIWFDGMFDRSSHHDKRQRKGNTETERGGTCRRRKRCATALRKSSMFNKTAGISSCTCLHYDYRRNLQTRKQNFLTEIHNVSLLIAILFFINTSCMRTGQILMLSYLYWNPTKKKYLVPGNEKTPKLSQAKPSRY